MSVNRIVLAESDQKNLASESAWDGSASRYSLDQYLAAVPDAIASYGRSVAKKEGRDVSKSDVGLPYKEPSGTINLRGVRAALAAIGGARTGRKPSYPSDVLAKARKQLEDVLAKETKKEEADGEFVKPNKLPLIAIPILTVGMTKKNGEEITTEIYSDVRDSYESGAHQAPVVDVPHEERGPALAYVETIEEAELGGKPWLVANVRAADEGSYWSLREKLAGPMKFNSPELELYSPDDWNAEKWTLRRVNLLGAQPPAQLGMPQSVYADARGREFYVTLADVIWKAKKEDAVKNEKKKFDDESKVEDGTANEGEKDLASSAMTCPTCGADYSNGEKYCPRDGTELSARMAESDEKPMEEDMAEKKVEEKVAGAEAKESAATEEKKLALAEAKKLADEVESLRKKDEERTKKFSDLEKALSDERNVRMKEKRDHRNKEITAEFDAMLRDPHPRITRGIVEQGAVELACYLDEKDGEKIKLADGKDDELSLYDRFKKILLSQPPLKTGELQVIREADEAKDERSILEKYKEEVRAANPKMSEQAVFEKAVALASKKDAKFQSSRSGRVSR